METSKPEVAVGGEREESGGWRYEATVFAEGRRRGLSVRLAWVDHDELCGGASAPSRVVEAAVSVAAERLGLDGLPERLDVSTLRRSVDGLGELVRSRL